MKVSQSVQQLKIPDGIAQSLEQKLNKGVPTSLQSRITRINSMANNKASMIKSRSQKFLNAFPDFATYVRRAEASKLATCQEDHEWVKKDP